MAKMLTAVNMAGSAGTNSGTDNNVSMRALRPVAGTIASDRPAFSRPGKENKWITISRLHMSLHVFRIMIKVGLNSPFCKAHNHCNKNQ